MISRVVLKFKRVLYKLIKIKKWKLRSMRILALVVVDAQRYALRLFN
jgi:hypothetical protein